MGLLINMTITTTVTAAGILLIKTIFKDRMSAKLHVLVWIILAIRMMIPILPESKFSVFNFIPTSNNIDVNVSSNQSEQTKEDINTTTHLDGQTPNQPIQEEEKANNPFSIIGFLEQNIISLWLMGAAVLFFYFTYVYIKFSIQLAKLDDYYEEEAVKALDQYKELIGIRRSVSITRYGDSSMLKGFFRPTIIIPKGYESKELKFAIIHELCHLKNNHILTNFFSTILLCLNWYNPIIWICHTAFRRDIELLCDQRVLQFSSGKKEYATLLLKTSTNQKLLLPITTYMNSSKREIKRRIHFMANYKKPSVVWTVVMVISIALLGVGCLSNASGMETEAFSHGNLNSLMGKDKQVVLETLKIDTEAEAEADIEAVGEKQVTYKFKESMLVNGKETIVSISFYNDVFMAYDYFYTNLEDGYNHIKNIRKQMGESYGEPTTYPILEKRLDNVKNLEDIKVDEAGVEFFEEWELEDSSGLKEKLLDGTEAERISMEIRLRCFQGNASMVTVRYSAVRKSLR